ncbi:MAG: SLC45 family MFS transporter [Spirochaetes bacterium]|nr:SLC45 family MFS transporter [Spirochaetota bacterium]
MKSIKDKQKTSRLDYAKTFVIGFGFFTTAITWSLYNSYVPIFLRKFISSAAIIGIIMTLDNWAAIIIQPWIGALSDRTRTGLGRRMPYITLGIPIAAVIFALIPYFSAHPAGSKAAFIVPLLGKIVISGGVFPLIAIIMLFNIAMAIYRAPVVALMPDVIPSVHRSKANGVINLMGGIGSIIAYLAGSYMYDIGVPVPFVVTGVIMILALVVLLVFIHEKLPEKAGEKKKEKIGILKAIGEIITGKEKSALFILLAILFWFIGFNSIETWFTTYGVEILKVKASAASRMLVSVPLMFVVFAIPAGFIGSSLGRKKTILIGIVLFVLDLSFLTIIHSVSTLYILLAVAGIAWALINVNSITIVWELASVKKIGTYTGLYYFFSSLAQIIAPPLAGIFMEKTSAAALFPFAIVFFSLSFVMMLGVRKGEAQTEAEIAEKEKFIDSHIDID